MPTMLERAVSGDIRAMRRRAEQARSLALASEREALRLNLLADMLTERMREMRARR